MCIRDRLRFIQALLGIFKGFFWSFIVQFSRFRFTQKFSFESSLSCETAYLLYHIFLSLSSTFSTFFKFFFDVSLKLFSSRFVCLSRRELLYYIIYSPSCQAFFCFWITAQRHSISCRILATGCTKDLRYQTFVTITLSFILPSLFIFALIHIYLSVLIYFLCHLLSFI